jgi:hypothetical protein
VAGSQSRPATRAQWHRDGGVRQILLALALAAGFLDAASYLGLGHTFPANMTGNTVLLAVAAARGSGTDALQSATALAGFAAGVAVGAGGDSPYPTPVGAVAVSALLGIERARDFVQEKAARIGHHGSRGGHSLLLASAGDAGPPPTSSQWAAPEAEAAPFVPVGGAEARRIV